MLLRRVLRRPPVRVSIETEVLRRVLRTGGCYRRRLEGRNTPFAEYDPLRVHPIYWRQYSAERQKFEDALLQNYFGFGLLLCIQHATDGSIQLIEVDP